MIGYHLYAENCSQPSNIIWENLAITRKTIYFRTFLVIISIGIFLCLVLSGFAVIKNLFVQKYKGFTFKNDCKPTDALFEGKLEDYKKYAQFDRKDFVESGQISDVYQCYCKTHSNVLAFFEKDDDCYPYQQINYWRQLYSIGVTVPIAIVNVLIRLFNVQVIKQIGYDYKTQEINMMIVSIAVA